MIYVTFHGDKGITNVEVYADSGSNAGKQTCSAALGPSSLDLKDAELRGIGLYGGYLWVANGSKSKDGNGSTLMLFTASTGTYPYTYFGTFASSTTTPAINHPFGFTFDGSGNCYVSNQDTNVVACLVSSGTPPVGAPLPGVPSGLPVPSPPTPAYLAGTLVASSGGGLDGTPPTFPVPAPQGLQYALSKGKVANSVRDVLYYSAWSALLVCDEVACAVKVYDLDGDYLASITTAQSAPTHLVVQASTLYIAAGTQVFTYALPAGAPTQDVASSPVPGISLEATAGMTFDDQGNLYVADRLAKAIYRCTLDGETWTQGKFVNGLGDQPEFLCYIKSS